MFSFSITLSLRILSFPKLEIFDLLAETANELGIKSYVVGGYVRDLLLKIPSKDIDVVVIGSGVEFAQALHEKMNSASISVFKNFGTAQIKYEDWIVEIIGARKESYRRDSRKPLVEDGTFEDDQNRRDFTVNSFYLGLNSDNYGVLEDPFGGIQDLNNGIIRTNTDSNKTFSDDPLRMLRAIRFAARFNFTIEEQTWNGIVENAHRIDIVSQERITDELNSMIRDNKPSKAFKLMFDAGLLKYFFPEMVELHGVETIDGKSHKDNFYHTLQVLDQLCDLSKNLWLRWAALLHDIAKPSTKRFDPKVGWTFHGHEDKGSRMVKGIFRRLRLPLDEKMKYVQKLVAMHLRPIVLSQDKVTDSAVRRLIVEAGDDVDDLLLLCQSDITSKNQWKVKRHIENLNKVQKKIQEVREKDELRNWQPIITGNHIMDRYLITNPKEIGVLKSELREAILSGDVQNTLNDSFKFLDLMAGNKGIQLKK